MPQARFVVFSGRKRSGWFWHLVGANNEIMAQSEAYVSRWGAARGAKRFAKLAQTAGIVVEITKK